MNLAASSYYRAKQLSRATWSFQIRSMAASSDRTKVFYFFFFAILSWHFKLKGSECASWCHFHMWNETALVVSWFEVSFFLAVFLWTWIGCNGPDLICLKKSQNILPIKILKLVIVCHVPKKSNECFVLFSLENKKNKIFVLQIRDTIVLFS